MINLKRVKAGDPIRARDYNQLIDAIEALRRGDNIETKGLFKSSADGRVTLRAPKTRRSGGLDPVPRPFLVSQVDSNKVQVAQGYVHWLADWIDPTWLGGDDFETDKTITATADLQLRVDIAVGAGDVTTSAVKIGWDVSATYSGLPALEYSIDFDGPWIDETPTDAEIVIDIATVTFVSGAITTIAQKLDYNPILPWNGDIDTTVIAGGTT